MSNVTELKGKPEVSRQGITRKSARNKEPAGKLGTTKECGVKRSILQTLSVSKYLLLAAGIAYGWEDLALVDPMQHYFVAILAGAAAVELLTFKFSKIQ